MLVKKKLNKFLDKAPYIRDLKIQLRLNKLREKNEFFNREDNNNFLLPNLPHPPLGSPPLLLPSDLFNIPNVPRIDEFLNNNDFNFGFSNGYAPPAPNSPLFRGFARNIFSKQTIYG